MHGRTGWRIIAAITAALVILAVHVWNSDQTVGCTDKIGCVALAPGEPIRIGVLQDQSGGAAPVGRSTINSIRLAADERGDRLLGHPLELRIEDERCTKEGGANGMLRLVADTEIVGILGTTCSDAAITASRIMSEAGLVMISGANTAPSLTGTGDTPGADWHPGYFRVAPSGFNWGKALAAFAVHELGITRAATIHDGDVFAVQHAQTFEERFAVLGGEIVLAAQIGRGDPEMHPVLRAVEESGAELVFAPLFLAESEDLILTAHALGLMESITFALAGSVVVNEWVDAVGDAGRGVYFTVTAPVAGPGIDAFRKRYAQTYGEMSEHPSHLFGYDTAVLLFHTIETTAVRDKDGTLYIGRQALRDTLTATRDFPGITGPLTCTPFGDCGEGQFRIVRFDDPGGGIDDLLANVIYTYTPE